MNNFPRSVKILALATVFAIVPNALAKKGGNAGGGNSGDPEPQYMAIGSLGINAISTNLSFESIIFRATQVALSGFTVFDPDNGGTCTGFGETTGTLVLEPRDDTIPDSASLRFGFQGKLSGSGSGKSVQYFLEMDGDNDSGDWPPVNADITTLSFSNWSIYAENRKSQKSDCAGEGTFAANEMMVGVSAE